MSVAMAIDIGDCTCPSCGIELGFHRPPELLSLHASWLLFCFSEMQQPWIAMSHHAVVIDPEGMVGRTITLLEDCE